MHTLEPAHLHGITPSLQLKHVHHQPWHATALPHVCLPPLCRVCLLQELMLSCMSLSKVEDIQLFTALTASAQLTKLFITTGDPDQDEADDTMPLPSGALQHMFSPPQQWPLLQASVTYGMGMPLRARSECCPLQPNNQSTSVTPSAMRLTNLELKPTALRASCSEFQASTRPVALG
jgi:hypothetical protein